jgi:hypothetical protein
MNCNPSEPGRVWRSGLASALVLALAACASRPEPVVFEPVMSAPPPPAAARPVPPPVYRVASGSPGVLLRFPRGTQVSLQTVICLKAGEQITVTGSNGQSVTYNRPGCLKRNGPVTGENAGGFTFGWARPLGASVREAAK